jgi:crotonobetainyl-CoA:carnitine CoA-transferase CaiB-like acyl-CoA transferase
VNRAALKAEIEAALASDSAINWDAKFVDAGVPAGRVMSVPEILAHPHMVSREFVHEFNGDDAATRQRVTRAGFRFVDADTAPTSPAPVLSANTRDHLSVLGFDAAEIDQLRAEGVI